MSPCHTMYGNVGSSHSFLLADTLFQDSNGFLLPALGAPSPRAFFELIPQTGHKGGAEELIPPGLAFGQ